ncbi:MAG: ATPase [Mangrovibacterium sp.]
MRLVADSGSSKTDWVILKDRHVELEFQTSGINPFFRDTNSIEQELSPILKCYEGKIKSISFYGAGVVNAQKGEVIAKAFRNILGDVCMEIESDLLGAARALSGNVASIVCILGTGSNVCLYDGSKVIQQIPAMGFILGDEASGAVLGRQLIGDYFKGIMPINMQQSFYEKYHVEALDVIENTYRSPSPNRYLAQFAMFLGEHKKDSYIQSILANQFENFVVRNILQIANARDYTVNIVGSIGYHFKEEIEIQLKKKGLNLGVVLKSPIEGLK